MARDPKLIWDDEILFIFDVCWQLASSYTEQFGF